MTIKIKRSKVWFWSRSNPDNHNTALKAVRRWKEANKAHVVERRRIIQKEYRKNHPEIIKAHQAVHRAIGAGKLRRTERCQICWEEKPVQAHHEDYAKTLDVVWLCCRCHGTFDRSRDRKAGRKGQALYKEGGQKERE